MATEQKRKTGKRPNKNNPNYSYEANRDMKMKARMKRLRVRNPENKYVMKNDKKGLLQIICTFRAPKKREGGNSGQERIRSNEGTSVGEVSKES